MPSEQIPHDRRRPTRADQDAYQNLQATVLNRALADVKVWRNGYVMLVSGLTAILALVGTQLASGVAWYWRVTLSLTLGLGIILVARALAYTLRIEGGKSAMSVNLQQIVKEYNSFEMYEAQEAATALEQLDRSKKWAGWGATCCLMGLICTLWMTGTSNKTPRPSSPTSSSTTTIPTSHRPTK